MSILRNKHGQVRYCSRCKVGLGQHRVKSEYLCSFCLEKRKQRQAQEIERQRTAKRCICGKTIAQELELCLDCAVEKEHKDYIGERLNTLAIDPELKDFLEMICEKLDLF